MKLNYGGLLVAIILLFGQKVQRRQSRHESVNVMQIQVLIIWQLQLKPMHADLLVRLHESLRTILLNINSSRYRRLHESIHIAHLIPLVLKKALDSISPWLCILVDLRLLALVLVLLTVVEHMLIQILKLPIVDYLCFLLVEVVVDF